MKKVILALIILFTGISSLKAQVHAGPEKYIFNICTGDTTRIGLPPIPDVLYSWPEIPEVLEYYGDTISIYGENNGPGLIEIQNFVNRYYLSDLSVLTDTLIIRIFPPIEATLPEMNHALCFGDTLEIFYPSVPFGYMYAEPDSSANTILDMGSPHIQLFPPASTVYDLYVANLAGCKLGPYPLTVNLLSQADSVRLTLYDSICFNSDPFLLDYWPADAVVTGPGVLGDGYFYPDLAGPGTHTLTINRGFGPCLLTATKTITILTEADVSFPDIPNLCENDLKIALDMGLPTGGIYLGDGVEAGFFNPAGLEPGNHEIYYNFVGADECRIQKAQTVFIKTIPPKTGIAFVGDSLACEGDTLTLRTTIPAMQYEWSTGATTPEIKVWQLTLCYVTIIASNGCRNYSDTLLLAFNPIPEVSLSSPEYPNGYNTSSYSLEDGSIELEVLAGVEPLSFLWSNGDTSQNPDSLAAGTYWVVASDPGGCAVADTITLSRPDTTILPPPPPVTGLLLPNSFTPNGDGFNDAYVIRGMDPDYLNNELLVFDIRRQLVFSAKNYSNTWKGLDNSGNKLPAGNYFVVFLSDKLSAPITLAVYLKYE